jgi:hypothetical protein
MKSRARRARKQATASPPSPRITFFTKTDEFLKRYAGRLTIALVLFATARIAATYNIFSYVFDEPAHLACGMEWLERHTYT